MRPREDVSIHNNWEYMVSRTGTESGKLYGQRIIEENSQFCCLACAIGVKLKILLGDSDNLLINGWSSQRFVAELSLTRICAFC